MKRREFITLVGGAATWPFVARAQQMPTVGFLNSGSSAGSRASLAAFLQGPSEIDYVEGRNVAIEYRWAEGRYDRLPALAADLAQRRVAVIAATGGTVAPLAAKDATTAISIVCVFDGDPVAFGLVASINRPGGNITGISLVASVIGAKQLELLHELAPNATIVALLVNPSIPNAEIQSRATCRRRPARSGSIPIAKRAASATSIPISATLDRLRAGALVIATDPFFSITAINSSQWRLVTQFGPTIYGRREFAALGGLISYGTSLVDTYRQIGVYAGRILKGAKPADCRSCNRRNSNW